MDKVILVQFDKFKAKGNISVVFCCFNGGGELSCGTDVAVVIVDVADESCCKIAETACSCISETRLYSLSLVASRIDIMLLWPVLFIISCSSTPA